MLLITVLVLGDTCVLVAVWDACVTDTVEVWLVTVISVGGTLWDCCAGGTDAVRDERLTSTVEVSTDRDESVSVDVWNFMIGEVVWLSDVTVSFVVVTVVVVGLMVVSVAAYAPANATINPSAMASFAFMWDHVAAATAPLKFM